MERRSNFDIEELKTYLWKGGNFLLEVGAVFRPEIAIAIAGVNTFKGIYLKEEIDNFTKEEQEKFYKLFNENIDFQHLLLQVSDSCNRCREEAKAKMFCKFIKGAIKSEDYSQDSSFFEETIYCFSDLSWRQILILDEVKKFYDKEGGSSNSLEPEIEYTKRSFKKLNYDKVKEYSQGLIYELNKMDISNLDGLLGSLVGKGLLEYSSVGAVVYRPTNYLNEIYDKLEDLEKYLDEKHTI